MSRTVYFPVYLQACKVDTLFYLPGNKYSKTVIMNCRTLVPTPPHKKPTFQLQLMDIKTSVGTSGSSSQSR